VGALTDFGPLLANPKTLLLGAAAQFGIFATLLGAIGLSAMGIFDFSLKIGNNNNGSNFLTIAKYKSSIPTSNISP
jgi:Na+-transporting methylmalonyl-CoA/oxaloacetate decarboxylase beta subunit